MSGCRIGKVKFKSGGEMHVLPESNRNFTCVNLGWGEVVFRAYDDEPLRLKDINYMCDAVKLTIMSGRE